MKKSGKGGKNREEKSASKGSKEGRWRGSIVGCSIVSFRGRKGEKGGLYKAREFAAMKADNTGSVANRSLVK